MNLQPSQCSVGLFHLYSSWLGLLNCFGRPTSKIAYSYDLQLGALPVSLHTGLSTGWPVFPQSIMSRLKGKYPKRARWKLYFFFWCLSFLKNHPMSLCMCAQLLSCVWLFVTPRTVGSSVHGISQARILQCLAISFSRGPNVTHCTIVIILPRDEVRKRGPRLLKRRVSKSHCMKSEANERYCYGQFEKYNLLRHVI